MAQIDEQKSAMIRMAWRRWLLLFVPSMAVSSVAIVWLGFPIVMTVLVGILLGTLLYQRYVNRRSWRSIMWGVYANDD